MSFEKMISHSDHIYKDFLLCVFYEESIMHGYG